MHMKLAIFCLDKILLTILGSDLMDLDMAEGGKWAENLFEHKQLQYQ